MHTEPEELGPPEHPAWTVDLDAIATRTVAVGGVDLTVQVPSVYQRRAVVMALDAAFLATPPSEPNSDLDAWQLDVEAGLLWREVPKLGAAAFLPATANQDARDAADALFEYAKGMVTIQQALDEVRVREFAP
jgi:hypothetical protein